MKKSLLVLSLVVFNLSLANAEETNETQMAATEAEVKQETITVKAEVMELHDAITAKKEAIKAAKAEIITVTEDPNATSNVDTSENQDTSLLQKAVTIIFGLFQ